MVRVEHRFVSVNGLRLHLLDFGGSGRPIVCLHGVAGHAWIWHDVAPRLMEIGRPLALDLRGYGDSQWSRDRAYTTEDHAADVQAVAEALRLGPVDVVGFSWGGLVGLALAAAAPALVRRLALVDIAPSSSHSETEIPALPGRFADHAEAMAAERRLSPRADERMIHVMAAYGTRAAPDGALVRKLDPLFLERWPFRRDDRWDELRSLEQPVLVVRAEHSQVLSDEEATRMVGELGNGSLARIPASGHLVPVENPAGLADALAEFLA